MQFTTINFLRNGFLQRQGNVNLNKLHNRIQNREFLKTESKLYNLLTCNRASKFGKTCDWSLRKSHNKGLVETRLFRNQKKLIRRNVGNVQ